MQNFRFQNKTLPISILKPTFLHLFIKLLYTSTVLQFLVVFVYLSVVFIMVCFTEWSLLPTGGVLTDLEKIIQKLLQSCTDVLNSTTKITNLLNNTIYEFIHSISQYIVCSLVRIFAALWSSYTVFVLVTKCMSLQLFPCLCCNICLLLKLSHFISKKWSFFFFPTIVWLHGGSN